jgi:cytochrome oxidase Cu insertion factor (SCO1/SenC/PrrC family)
VGTFPKAARIGVVVVAALLAGVWSAASRTEARALEVGDRAPDFTLPSTTGENISLSQFRGKKLVLLEFYAADFRPV